MFACGEGEVSHVELGDSQVRGEGRRFTYYNESYTSFVCTEVVFISAGANIFSCCIIYIYNSSACQISRGEYVLTLYISAREICQGEHILTLHIHIYLNDIYIWPEPFLCRQVDATPSRSGPTQRPVTGGSDIASRERTSADTAPTAP